MKLQKTTDYKQFKSFGYNRNIYNSHVQNLQKSIGKHNLLEFFPILVDGQMRVIDGQHRLAAAKALGIPVYYIQTKDLTFDDVVLLNANNRKWTSIDYLKSYAEQGLKDYIILRDFCSKYEISVPLGIVLLNQKYNLHDPIMAPFKQGFFEADDIEAGEKAMELILKMKPYCADVCWRDRAFIKATKRILEDGFEDDLLAGLERAEGKVKLERAWNMREYMRQFERFVNYGRGRSTTKNYKRLF